MNYQQEERAKKIRELKEIFYKVYLKDDTISRRLLKTEWGMERGISPEKVDEYLKQLEDAGFIKTNGGLLWMERHQAEKFSRGMDTTLYS